MQTMEGEHGMMSAAPSLALLKRCGSSCGSEQALKRVKFDDGDTISYSDGSHAVTAPQSDLAKAPPTVDRVGVVVTAAAKDGVAAVKDGLLAEPLPTVTTCSDSNCPGDASAVSHSATESNGSLSVPSDQPPTEQLPEEVIPLKATHFRHLNHKYLSELEYMLREFQKLERQLLGAKTAGGSATTESAASRERREKLHSFIQHLEDTIQQIITGVELEAAGKSTCPSRPDRDTALSTHLTREKEEEENVQKIEEHILANLLPVKVRLKKQLAAQQGAKHNPAGMPPVRGGGMSMQTDASKQGKATFLKGVPERHPSQFGKPLNGGGSGLTQKLHGPTLGSTNRAHGHGVGQNTPPPVTGSTSSPEIVSEKPAAAPSLTEEKEQPKILYAGLALGSGQIQSSVSAASLVHKIVIQDPALLEVQSELHSAVHNSATTTPTSNDHEVLKLAASSSDPWELLQNDTAGSDDYDDDEPDHIYSKHGTQLSLAAQAAILSYEERRKVRKKRRKKKKLLLQQQQQQAAAAAAALPKRKKIVKKRGPRNVEYMCALCNEIYSSTCDHNPWWALSQHDCPKCGKMQVR
jgi:hypothetical protein